MLLRALLTWGLLLPAGCAWAGFEAVMIDRSLAGSSTYPTASDPSQVGKYPGLVKSGGGYFYDDVLEYRVWLHPERGAEKKNGNSDYFMAFAQYEKALAFSRGAKGAEEPLVLIRQLKHINEPEPGVFEVVEGERLAEWRVQWLSGSKRRPGSIEQFLAERRR
jgi:hypothetical protein